MDLFLGPFYRYATQGVASEARRGPLIVPQMVLEYSPGAHPVVRIGIAGEGATFDERHKPQRGPSGGLFPRQGEAHAHLPSRRRYRQERGQRQPRRVGHELVTRGQAAQATRHNVHGQDWRERRAEASHRQQRREGVAADSQRAYLFWVSARPGTSLHLASLLGSKHVG